MLYYSPMPWLLGLWMTLVVLNYAVAPGHHASLDDLTGFFLPRHGAFSLQTLVDSWRSRGHALAGWLALNAGIAGAGAVAGGWLGFRRMDVRSWLMGLAPVSLLLLGLGLCGLMLHGALAFVLAGSAVGLWPGRRRWRWPGRDAWLAAAPCLIALPAALAPEIVFDALRYHLALPDLYLRDHRVHLVERFLFASYPQGMEMLFAPALAFGTVVTAKLLAWQTFPLAAMMLQEALARWLTRWPCQALCLGFTAMPFLSVHAATAGVDLPVISLELAGFLLLAKAAAGSRSARHTALAGWLFGTAFGLKYLAAFAFAAALISLLVAAPGAFLGVLGGTLPWVVALSASWGAKNFLLTGNPAYPYGLGHWQLEPETFRRHLQWAADWRQTHPWWSAWVALVPVSLTRGIYDALGEALAPAMFFVVALAAAAARPLERSARFWLALCGLLWTIWIVAAGGIYRYLAPLYPAVLITVGVLLPRLRGIAPRAVTAALLLGAGVQVAPLLTAQYRSASAAGVLLGWESERDYLARVIPPGGRYLPAMARACEAAGSGRLLVLGDPKTFYAPGRCVTEFEFAPTLLFRLAEDTASADRLRIGLRQRDITAALYRVEGMISMGAMSGATLHGPALARYQTFWGRWMQWVWTDEHPSENVFYQCAAVRRVPGQIVRPVSGLRFALPGLEALTQELDHALEAHRPGAALQMALELVRREPDYAAGWLRLREAARAAGAARDVRDATAHLRALGYEARPAP